MQIEIKRKPEYQYLDKTDFKITTVRTSLWSSGNLPANAGDMGSIPALGRFHRPWGN